MSDNDTPKDDDSKRLADSWSAGSSSDYGDYLFKKDELDIYCNKLTHEAFIFHGKKIDYSAIDKLIYDPDQFTVTIMRKDGRRLDLGIKIEWMMRPYLSRAKEVSIVRTKDGVSVDGIVVPIIHASADKKA